MGARVCRGIEAVGQFVYTSFSGHLDLDFPLAVAKRTVEGWVRASGLEWTILRPGYFMEVWLTPAVGFDPLNASATIYGTGEAPISWISTRDVASFAIASLSHPAARNAVLELGGPRPVTPLEAVKVFEAVIGRPIALTFVPTEALEARQAADTDPMGQSFAGLMRCYAKGDPIEMGRTMTILPHAMVSVPEYAATIRQGVASH